MCLPEGFYQDQHPRAPYKRRVYADGYAKLDPLSFPWDQWRRSPEDFPDYHFAKIASVRTVVGGNFFIDEGKNEWIYFKRSYNPENTFKKILSNFRSPKEWKELLLAGKFLSAGVVVPQPVFYAEATEPSGRFVVFYATRSFTKQWQEVRQFFKSVNGFGEEWKSLARYTKWLHDNGILHSDYRGDHIWFHQQSYNQSTPPYWALMDLDGSRIGKPVSRSARQRALYQLTESLIQVGLKEESLADFISLYDPGNCFSLSASKIYQVADVRDRVAQKRRAGKGKKLKVCNFRDKD